jgi:hypothetical protein
MNEEQVWRKSISPGNVGNVGGYGLIGFSTYATDLNLIASCMGGLPNAFA